jgi:hypothetical protein
MNKAFLLDLTERTVATYAQAFAGLLLADSTHLMSLGTVRAAAVAALPAVLAVVKGALGGSIFSGSAAWLPTPKPAPTPTPAADPAPAAAPTPTV